MFREQLKDELKQIFDFPKVSFDTPSEDREQEVLFVQIDVARNNVKDTSVKSRVEGRLLVYANSDKFPFGYLEKQIQAADPSLTKNFFFYDITGNAGTLGNIAERTASFIYFYSGQYDPNKGSITSVTIGDLES